ncbi:MAG: YajQ family cyclic di-GMP-binding protein [Synechococcales cyanobacterium RU_4_20]|nr:YajQ family cyclic di-GMP-binding protein [Synechococcales cyanobacterium RU_4_20]NKB16856.1 YajQ family cyclic di-GMP-binding protein [Pseudanabaena sp. CRU_2_10]
MASSSSFDVVSEFDFQELVNAVDQAEREIKTRYDLKDTKTEIDLSPTQIVIATDSDFTLEAVHTILQTKAAKRGLSLKIFEYGKVESASGNRVRQEISLKKGIETELAKKISKSVRDAFKDKKVQVAIQGDALRVTGKSKDELQLVMQYLRQEEWPVALQFNNYR